MNLAAIVRQILEADDVYALHGGNPDLLEFPEDNFVVSLIPQEKRMELSPRDDSKASNRIRSLINGLRNGFTVSKVVQLGMNTFNVVMDPAEDYDKVAAYVKDFA